MSGHPLWHVRDKMAKLIHQRSGHVENHSGSGGCFEAADEIIGMLPADMVKARADLEDLEERAGLILAERDAIAGERDRLRAVLTETPENACRIADLMDPQRRDPDIASHVLRTLAALRSLAASPSPSGGR